MLQVGLRDGSEPLVLRQRLDVPDRHRRRPRPRLGEPVRARLPGLGARTVVPGGRAPTRTSRSVALDHFAYFPGTALTAAVWRLVPVAVRRLPRLRPPLHPRALPRRARLRRAAPVEARDRRGARGEPARDPRRVVRDGRRAEPPPHGARVRARHALALRPRRRLSRRRRAAEAVRARGGAVRRRDDAHPRRAAARPLPRGRSVRRSPDRRDPAVRDRRPGRPLGRHDRLRRADLPDHRLRPRRDPGSRLEILDDRFGSYPFLPLALLIWLPLTAVAPLEAVAARGARGSARRASPSRSSPSCTWRGCSRRRT